MEAQAIKTLLESEGNFVIINDNNGKMIKDEGIGIGVYKDSTFWEPQKIYDDIDKAIKYFLKKPNKF